MQKTQRGPSRALLRIQRRPRRVQYNKLIIDVHVPWLVSLSGYVLRAGHSRHMFQHFETLSLSTGTSHLGQSSLFQASYDNRQSFQTIPTVAIDPIERHETRVSSINKLKYSSFFFFFHISINSPLLQVINLHIYTQFDYIHCMTTRNLPYLHHVEASSRKPRSRCSTQASTLSKGSQTARPYWTFPNRQAGWPGK